MFEDEINKLPPAPRRLRRSARVSKDPEAARLWAVIDAAERYREYESRMREFEDLFAVTARLQGLRDVAELAEDGQIGETIMRLRWIIADCNEAIAARARYLAVLESVPDEEGDESFERDKARVRAKPPIDTEVLYLILWELEAESARREKERRDARRKPPREATVVEVPPVVIDTSCSMCERDRHFIIDGVAYCKRHVPADQRPHGRI